MEEGLDKQLDSYWGKAENQEVKNVYKFNCNSLFFLSQIKKFFHILYNFYFKVKKIWMMNWILIGTIKVRMQHKNKLLKKIINNKKMIMMLIQFDNNFENHKNSTLSIYIF